jgi:hypothetical protein
MTMPLTRFISRENTLEAYGARLTHPSPLMAASACDGRGEAEAERR